jgi:hypothetical protein
MGLGFGIFYLWAGKFIVFLFKISSIVHFSSPSMKRKKKLRKLSGKRFILHKFVICV